MNLDICSFLVRIDCVAKKTWMKAIFSCMKNALFSSQLSPWNTGNCILGLWNSKIFWGSMPPDPTRGRGLTAPCHSHLLYSNLLATSVIIEPQPVFCKLIGYMSEHNGPILSTCICLLCPESKDFVLSRNIYVIDQTCSVKMAKYWPCASFVLLWTSTLSQSMRLKSRTWPVSSHLELTLGDKYWNIWNMSSKLKHYVVFLKFLLSFLTL